MLFLTCWYGLFLLKQNTAYEMRISGWSSDVCSSDLCTEPRGSPLMDKTPEQIIQSLTKYTRNITLRSFSDLYDQGKQNLALGPFSKAGEATVPCFLGGDDLPVPDMRFAAMDPDETGRAQCRE